MSSLTANTLSFDAALACAREWSGNYLLPSGEPLLEHALGCARIIETLSADLPMRMAALLFAVADRVPDAEQVIGKRFGLEVARLVAGVRKLVQLGAVSVKATRIADGGGREIQVQRLAQLEALRKMLLAFAQDIRVVLIRLASHLQTLRYYAVNRRAPAAGFAREMLDIYAPLANRLGIWQIKWELEDLAFRFAEPKTYQRIAKLLDEERAEREAEVKATIKQLDAALVAAGIRAEVSGRPKHLYSIWRKMRDKRIDFAALHDVQALRIIVADVHDCYAVLSIVHNLWQPVLSEFDDYISRPKSNGYQSLHTVVSDNHGRTFEVQIRTEAMHRFAEYGVAAHWRYKEMGSEGHLSRSSADHHYDQKIAWLRQLLAWQRDVTAGSDTANAARTADGKWQTDEAISQPALNEPIYVLTPQAQVIALPQGATPIDFAYHLHTDLGHRCRGARVDGLMVPLNRPLANAQTVEIVTVKRGGPSRDWLNPQLGYLVSTRAKRKVRAWFNHLETQQTIAAGRAKVEKILQRDGKLAVKLDELAARLGFKTPDELFLHVGHDETSLRQVEQALLAHPSELPQSPDLSDSLHDAPAAIVKRASGASVAKGASSGVLVVGVDALLTQLARCCRPAPPDLIAGFVTRGKGVSIHRKQCPNFRRMANRAPERVLQTAWSDDVLAGQGKSVYPVNLTIEAIDRQGLLRDISEVFAREKMNVVGASTVTWRNVALMRFTVEVSSTAQLQRAAALLGGIDGVTWAGRRT